MKDATEFSDKVIGDQVIAVVAEFLGIDEKDISLGSNLSTDLGLDSLGRVELASAIEREFSVDMPEILVEVVTVAGIVDCVAEALTAQAG